jgi:DNA-binding response OmpR family regulator
MKILIVEDEKLLSRSIQEYLESSNCVCEIASTKNDAFLKISLYEYDCILLDLSLPDGHGFEILKELKSKNKTEGVIIISAKENLETRIEGLQLGADDYLTKPFHLSELLVRIQALIRRKQFQGQNLITFNEISIDILSKNVLVNSKLVSLTKKELELLLFLIGNQGKVLSKSSIAEHLSGDMADMFDNHDFVYAHIKNLKKKLVEFGAVDYVKSVYGIGYKWEL